MNNVALLKGFTVLILTLDAVLYAYHGFHWIGLTAMVGAILIAKYFPTD